VDLLKRAKCQTLFIGVESINPEALKDMHKSQSVRMIKDSISTLLATGLRVHSMFILGADSDTSETMEETIRFSKSSGSTTAQFSILFPIPGTPLYDEVKAQDRIYINDWQYYDGSHSVILPRNISPLKLQQKLIHAYRHFYSRKVLHWLASRIGFFIWKILNKKYMKYLRYFSRKLKKEGIVKDGVLTLKGLRTDAIPRILPEITRGKMDGQTP
jgi:anaerobic magnesium-protoporphyrin IX monomethyl ester cyclase